MKISIVSPVYKAEKIIPTLVERIQKSVAQLTADYEIILVEDGGLITHGRLLKVLQRQIRK
ncbi:hypothetical protein [Flavobacterium sp. 3HN19-14]|uniref:hypothetical protein n=1 Tax=Flavobacterium sp. 3HN19-14 TaxID=3448133 RepID=UPI003EDEA296